MVKAAQESFKGVSSKCDQTENLVYEFRKESFTGIYEVEKTFIAKSDSLRRGLLEICKHLNV
jgi:hypothetical protein